MEEVNADAWCAFHYQPFEQRADINLAQATVALTQQALRHADVRGRLSFDPEATAPTRERTLETQQALAAVSPLCCLLGDEAVDSAIRESADAPAHMKALDAEMRKRASEARARRAGA